MKGRPPANRKRGSLNVTKSVATPPASASKVKKKNKQASPLENKNTNVDQPIDLLLSTDMSAINLNPFFEKENVAPKPNAFPFQSLNLGGYPQSEEKMASTKKYKKNPDPAWRPYNNTFKGNFFSTFSMMTGKTENKATVTSVIVHSPSKVVGDEHKEQFYQTLQDEFKEIESFQELGEITRFSSKGSPLQGITKQGITVNRSEVTNTNGFRVSTFTNVFNTPVKPIKPVESLELSDIPATPFKQNVKINTDSIKEHEVVITPDFFKKVQKEKKVGVSRNQNQVMKQQGVKEAKASAANQAINAKIGSEDTDWQWLHLIANFILGEASQHDKNLVAGTKFSNAEMLIAEAQLKKISDHYPEGFTLRVTAHMVKGPKKNNSVEYTQIASKITYQIITPDFTKTFEFNAQRQNAPASSYFHYVTAVLNGMLKFFKNESSKDKKDVASLAYTLESSPNKKGAIKSPQIQRTLSNPNQFFSTTVSSSTAVLTPSKYRTPRKGGV